MSTDIYELSGFMEELKSKHIDLPSETLMMSTFGYLNSMGATILQNATRMASEYSNEAIPVKAKFEKNLIAHALSLGIDKIQASPAYMQIIIGLPEDRLIANMKNDVFTLDKDFKIMVEGYEYHLDYDIVITRNKLSDNEYTYTAIYDMTEKNPLSTVSNPYFPSLAVYDLTNITMVFLPCAIRQVEYKTVFRKILSDNPLENKIINFEFENQLAAFNVSVNENGSTTKLVPVFDGLYDQTVSKYCNYSYIDSSTIRVKFDKNSYQPKLNADVTINLYTTHGAECNFAYKDDIILSISSERFSYNDIFMLIRPTGDSDYGIDKKTIDDIKKIIPREALSRGSVTNTTDLNNFFNSINDSNGKLYIYKKTDNQLERAYFAYLVLKYENIVIPTNTIDITVLRNQFNYIGATNYILNAGNKFHYRKGEHATVVTDNTITDQELEDTGFLYMNPFMIVVNKSPFYVSYYLNIMNNDRLLNFDYINRNSRVQFMATTINWKREFFTDRNTYKLNITMMQNMNNNFELITYNDDKTIKECKITVYAVIYSKGVPLAYKEANLVAIGESYTFDFEAKFTTDDTIDHNTRMKLSNVCKAGTNIVSDQYFDSTVDMKIFSLIDDGNSSTIDEIDLIVPGLDGQTLTNTYSVIDGVDLFKNYTDIMSSNIIVGKNEDVNLVYRMSKVPMIRATYINTELRMSNFIKALEKRRVYIQYCTGVLEDNFRIDFKFFNTYGPSYCYEISSGRNIDRINLEFTFRAKLVTINDKYILDYILADIKNYIEDIGELTDIHIPNIITEITNKYRERLVYFGFLDINGHGPGFQHVYKVDYKSPRIVPEFLNVNTRDDNTPSITIQLEQ